MTELTLYTTLGCHLCEKAEAVIAALPSSTTVSYQSVEIAEDPHLIEQYGIRIPVLKKPSDGSELGWPFDSEQLMAWLKAS